MVCSQNVCLIHNTYSFIAGDKKIEEGPNPKVSKTTTDEKKTGKDDTDIMVAILKYSLDDSFIKLSIIIIIIDDILSFLYYFT